MQCTAVELQPERGSLVRFNVRTYGAIEQSGVLDPFKLSGLILVITHIFHNEVLNPKGIPPQSPGLLGTSYPGWMFVASHNPNGVASSSWRAGRTQHRSQPRGATLSGLKTVAVLDPG